MNVNSLLIKNYEIQAVGKISNIRIIDISKSKLDNSINDSKISVEGVIWRDRNRKSGGAVSAIVFVTTIKAGFPTR